MLPQPSAETTFPAHPFCWCRAYLPRTLPEVTSQAESVMTSFEVISG